MVNFIICDDSSNIRKAVTQIIDSYMMKNKIEYKTHIYSDYDNTFLEIIDKKLPSKIYILDIETPTSSGIDIARYIRKNDLNSVIIFLTGHEELLKTTVSHDLMFLAYINKFDNFEGRLEKTLDKSFKILGQRQILTIEEKGALYTINLNDILYITRDSIDRKSIIVTDYGEIKSNKPLSELLLKLNDNFIKSHRACIVNKKRVVSMNKTRKEIIFDNNETIDLISNKYKKEKV